MAEGGGDENLGSFGDRKRREMIERMEDRKRRREVADVQPVKIGLEVKPGSVPAEGEVLQPIASPPTSPSVSHSDSSDTEDDLQMSRIEEIAERVQ